jgi:folate-binding protein YgfZ
MSISSLPVHEVSRGSESASGFAAAITTVCELGLPEIGWIRVTGEDRVRWLNGMVTNSIQALAVGEGCFNFLLNAQGRIQGTATAFAEAEAILLETDRAQVAPMMAMLDRFIIMDDVELADISEERAGLLVVGPGAAGTIEAMGLLAEGCGVGAAAGIRFAEVTWAGAAVRVQAMAGKVVARFELWSSPDTIEKLAKALGTAGAVAGGVESVEMLRLIEGTPKFGVDIRERELPQETGQMDALHFSKGCYLGQEIVERIRSRGAVHRTFAAFALRGEVPAAGAVLSAGGKVVGELTSVGEVPAVPERVAGGVMALGYIRREALEMRQEIGYEGGVAEPLALPVLRGTPA